MQTAGQTGGFMTLDEAVKALGALAQETRLSAFRRLVRAGPDGVAAGALATALEVPANTLSFHLSHLAQAGLAVPRREGRSIVYTADFARMNGLLGFLTENCCGGGRPVSVCCPPPAPSTAPSTDGPVMTEPRLYTVLFLCTGNSARSIMAEAALSRWGAGRFRAFSAGSHPTGRVNPLALKLLEQFNYDTAGFRSKSWDEFAVPGAPPLDFVFTVCDNAAGEMCPVWPGQPMTAHWGVEDPAAFDGPEEQGLKLFRRVYLELEHRIKLFTSLRVEALDRLSLQSRLTAIGTAHPEDAP